MISTKDWLPLTLTDLDLAARDGIVERHDDCWVIRRPDNPGYYWGNYLLLQKPPVEGTLSTWIDRSREVFAHSPKVRHVTLRWDGGALAPTARAEANLLGMRSDGGAELIAPSLTPREASDIDIRPLDANRDRDAIVALNIACDPAEQTGGDSYRTFKSAIRQSWWKWQQSSDVTWWGAYRHGELVAQCGMVLCGTAFGANALGRFQSVETHPDHRRRGICSALISTVGRHALEHHKCKRVLLGVDIEGPALQLYRRLGFEPGGIQRCLILGGDELRIREEQPADYAGVRSLITAAFEAPGEARLIDTLRGESGVISLLAERAGTLLGHALFSPVTIDRPTGPSLTSGALGPIGVRPSQQRRGVGSALIQEGIKSARRAGWTALFVLGDPAYYRRFGFVAASEWKLDCEWEVPDGVFQALELVPGSLTGGAARVQYHRAFQDLG